MPSIIRQDLNSTPPRSGTELLKEVEPGHLEHLKKLLNEGAKQLESSNDVEKKKVLFDFLKQSFLPYLDSLDLEEKETKRLLGNLTDSMIETYSQVSTEGFVDPNKLKPFLESASLDRLEGPSNGVTNLNTDLLAGQLSRLVREKNELPTLKLKSVKGRPILKDSVLFALMVVAAGASSYAIGGTLDNFISGYLSDVPDTDAVKQLLNESFQLAPDFITNSDLGKEYKVGFETQMRSLLSYGAIGLGTSLYIFKNKLKLLREVDDSESIWKGIKSFGKQFPFRACIVAAVIGGSATLDHYGSILQAAKLDQNKTQASKVSDLVDGVFEPKSTTFNPQINPTDFPTMVNIAEYNAAGIGDQVDKFLLAEKKRAKAGGEGPAYRSKKSALQPGMQPNMGVYKPYIDKALKDGVIDPDKGIEEEVETGVKNLQLIIDRAYKEYQNKILPQYMAQAEQGSEGNLDLLIRGATRPEKMQEAQKTIGAFLNSIIASLEKESSNTKEKANAYSQLGRQIDDAANLAYKGKSSFQLELDIPQPDFAELQEKLQDSIPPVKFSNVVELKAELFQKLETEDPERLRDLKIFSIVYPILAEMGDLIFILLLMAFPSLVDLLKAISRGKGVENTGRNTQSDLLEAKNTRIKAEESDINQRIDILVEKLTEYLSSILDKEGGLLNGNSKKITQDEVRFVLQQIMKSRFSQLTESQGSTGFKVWRTISGDARGAKTLNRVYSERALNNIQGKRVTPFSFSREMHYEPLDNSSIESIVEHFMGKRDEKQGDTILEITSRFEQARSERHQLMEQERLKFRKTEAKLNANEFRKSLVAVEKSLENYLHSLDLEQSRIIGLTSDFKEKSKIEAFFTSLKDDINITIKESSGERDGQPLKSTIERFESSMRNFQDIVQSLEEKKSVQNFFQSFGSQGQSV